MEEELLALHAQYDVRHTLSQYAIAVDDKRPELLSRLFTDTATLVIPEWKVEAAGKPAVVAFYSDYWSRFDQPRRYYANEDIRIQGRDATAFMYWHVTQERNGQAVIGWGTYQWTFRRDTADWLISGVVITILAMTTLAAGWAGANRFTDS
jgi:hypothetical protein